MQGAEPPFGGLAAAPASAFARLFASPGGIYEPEIRRPRSLGRRQGLRRRGRRRRRDRRQLLLVSSDARRADSGKRRARAWLPRHSRRPRQYRTAHRRDRASEAQRLLRAARFPEDRARQGARGGRGRLVDPQGARLRRGAAAEPCAPNSKAPASGRARPTPPPTSASSPMRPTGPTARSCRACWSTTTVIVELVTPGSNDPAAVGQGRRGRRHPARRRLPAPALRHRRPLRLGGAGAAQGLDGPRRPVGQGQGPLRPSGPDRRDRQAPPRAWEPAARGAARGRAGRDDALRPRPQARATRSRTRSQRRCRR